MCAVKFCFVFLTLNLILSEAAVGFRQSSFNCGPYGFICEGNTRLRLCEGSNLFGPSFLCPPNTLCNEDSSDVCESAINHVDSATKTIRCSRNERIADPNVPDCKGYILCIPNKNRFQGIKFKCSGNTIFNGYTRTCSSPDKYRCALNNSNTKQIELFGSSNRRVDSVNVVSKPRPIDCKNYKFSVIQELDKGPVKAAYFCPPRPLSGESYVRCTVFSNQFCITLEKENEDQFTQNSGAAYRKPKVKVI